jgi:predicted glycogen debranching enzyme
MPPTRTRSPLLRFDRLVGQPLADSLLREWLVTDGRGGFASSSMLLCHTRRYHGLLVTPPTPDSTKRHVFLSRYEDSLHRQEEAAQLSIARYRGMFAPHGHTNLEAFDLDPFPRFAFRFGRTEIVRELLVAHGAPTSLVRYHVRSPRTDLVLRLRPLLAFREADALTFENLHLDPRTIRRDDHVAFRPYPELPALALRAAIAGEPAPAITFDADPVWYRGIEYSRDLERGYDGHEDNFSPGTLAIDLPSSDAGTDCEVVVAASLDEAVSDPIALWHREAERRRALAAEIDVEADPLAVLRVGARDFLVELAAGGDGARRRGVIAGYPWFGEWGRDTYLSLPGLALAASDPSERRAIQRDVLESALPYLHDGLLPNIFGRSIEDSHYGSVDAALWFVRAVRAYELSVGGGSGREEVLDTFLPALIEIAEHYEKGDEFEGTRALGIHGDERSGLVLSGRPDLNPTWMDARTPNGPVTPRHGCPVEIGALWYFLLAYLEDLLGSARDTARAKRFGAMRKRAKRGFLDSFWIERDAYLADVWREDAVDRAIRPNMVLAAALEWSPLSRRQRGDVVRVAERELLTPFGLRTLAPSDRSYLGRYAGDPEQRDAAYHQGTVWPWLLGFWCEAWLRAFTSSSPFSFARRPRDEMRERLQGFVGHLREAGLLHVSEVFDGDPPHAAGGTIAQAWSTAELLRARALAEEGLP